MDSAYARSKADDIRTVAHNIADYRRVQGGNGKCDVLYLYRRAKGLHKYKSKGAFVAALQTLCYNANCIAQSYIYPVNRL